MESESDLEMLASLPFIVSTDTRKADPKTRKLIRSHVMQGKNRVKVRRKPQDFVEKDDLPEVLASAADDRSVVLSTIPRPICSDLSTIPFADDVEAAQVADVLACE